MLKRIIDVLKYGKDFAKDLIGTLAPVLKIQTEPRLTRLMEGESVAVRRQVELFAKDIEQWIIPIENITERAKYDHLVASVEELAAKARLKAQKIHVIQGENAFVISGTDKIYVSPDILSGLEHKELRAMVGHELGHIAHGDTSKLFRPSNQKQERLADAFSVINYPRQSRGVEWKPLKAVDASL